MMRLLMVCLVSACFFFSGLAKAQVFTKTVTPWPLIPDPPRSVVELVSSDMRTNGIPMKIWTFRSSASLEEVVAHFEAHWNQQDETQPVVVNGRRVGSVRKQVSSSKSIIAKIHGPYYVSVTVERKALGTASGNIAVSFFGEDSAKIDASGLALPSEARAISVVESADMGSISKVGTLVSTRSPQSVRDHYVNTLPSAGWTLLDKLESKTGYQGRPGTALFFSKNESQFSVLIGQQVRQGSTVFQVNLVTKK